MKTLKNIYNYQPQITTSKRAKDTVFELRYLTSSTYTRGNEQTNKVANKQMNKQANKKNET